MTANAETGRKVAHSAAGAKEVLNPDAKDEAFTDDLSHSLRLLRPIVDRQCFSVLLSSGSASIGL